MVGQVVLKLNQTEEKVSYNNMGESFFYCSNTNHFLSDLFIFWFIMTFVSAELLLIHHMKNDGYDTCTSIVIYRVGYFYTMKKRFFLEAFSFQSRFSKICYICFGCCCGCCPYFPRLQLVVNKVRCYLKHMRLITKNDFHLNVEPNFNVSTIIHIKIFKLHFYNCIL